MRRSRAPALLVVALAALAALIAFPPSRAELAIVRRDVERELSRSDELQRAREVIVSLRDRMHTLEVEKSQEIDRLAAELERLKGEVAEAQQTVDRVMTRSEQELARMRAELSHGDDMSLDLAQQFHLERKRWEEERESLLARLARRE